MDIIPVEVLNPHTLRPVNVIKYQILTSDKYDQYDIILNNTSSFIQLLDEGGGYYRDGLVYRYLYNYEGIPRKTIAEIVASITTGYQGV